jgi:Immunity protein 32
MFTVELNQKQETVEIFLDDEGIDRLIRLLTRLRGKRTHDHFMTPSWGGEELDEGTHGENKLVNHLIIYSTGRTEARRD